MSSVVAMRGALVLSALLLFAPGLARGQPTFGYGQFKPGPTPESTVVKRMLLIMVDFSDRTFDVTHNQAFYRDLFFGSSTRSVRGYFSASSGGRFTISEAGIVGPVRMTNDPATTEDESRSNCVRGVKNAAGVEICPGSRRGDEWDRGQALAAAIRSGFDFTPFDDNRDGTISDNELSFAVIFATGGWGGAYRGSSGGCVRAGAPPRSVNVCLNVALGVDDRTGFATAVHESAHQLLGAREGYGIWLPEGSNINFGSSIMAATIVAPDDRWTVNFDPWHRIKFGWSRPRVVAVDGPGLCTTLAPTLSADAAREPIVIYDPARGPGSYFILEYRRRAGYDQDAAEDGVAIWHIRETPQGDMAVDPWQIRRDPPANPAAPPTANIPSAAARAGDDLAELAFGFIDRVSWGRNGALQTPVTAPDALLQVGTLLLVPPFGDQEGRRYVLGTRGDTRFWRQEHGTAELRFPGETSLAGALVDVGPLSEAGVSVRIRTRGAAPTGPEACLRATTALPKPALAQLQAPRCIDRHVIPLPQPDSDGNTAGPDPSQPLRFDVTMDFQDPLPRPTAVKLTSPAAVNISPGETTVPAGQRRIVFSVQARPDFTFGSIDLDGEVRRSDVPGYVPYTETPDTRVLVLPDGPLSPDAGGLTCAMLARLREVSAIRRYRRPGPIPKGDPPPGIQPHILDVIQPEVDLPLLRLRRRPVLQPELGPRVLPLRQPTLRPVIPAPVTLPARPR